MKYKYIHSVPKPLLEDLLNNHVIPIVGAGFSKNADIPKGVSMPDWNELGKRVAEEINGYAYDGNAIDALSLYEELYTRSRLIEFLIKELHQGEIHPGETFHAFCKLFTGTICTTNFDTLLEDSLVNEQRPVSVIVTEDRLTVGRKDETRIIKIHGDFNHPDKMVVTERDYDLYLNRNPVMATYISNLFISNTMLLIGYSLDDADFRGVWQILRSRLGKMSRPAYCITVGISEEKRLRYQRRNITVINLEGEPKNYKTILRDFFCELKDYCTNATPTTSKPENDPNRIDVAFFFADATRLYEKKEYSACILSAYSAVMVFFYSLCDLKESGMEVSVFIRYYSSTYLVDDEKNQGQFEDNIGHDFVATRNKIAHYQYKATRKEADKYLKFAQSLAIAIEERSR